MKLHLNTGAIELLKWVALVAMTLDHVNTFLLGRTVEWMFEVGRIAFPIFGFVFAYHMGQSAYFETFRSRIVKLVIVGAAAQVFFVGLGVPWTYLNIMFTLVLGASAVYVLTAFPGVIGWVSVCVLLALPATLVDYGPLGVAYIVVSWYASKQLSLITGVVYVAALGALYAVNGNAWGYGALPVMLGALVTNIHIRRLRNAFYVFYPMHLAVLLLCSKVAALK